MAKAEKFQIPAMPLSSQLGEMTGISTKKFPTVTFHKDGEYPVLSFTSQGGATVTVGYVPATTREPSEGEGPDPVPVPAYYVANVDGVQFSTAEKRCPGKIKTAIRRAVGLALRAVKKVNGIEERSAARSAREDAKAAAKAVLAKL